MLSFIQSKYEKCKDFINCYGLNFFLTKIYIKLFLTLISRVYKLYIPKTYSFITLGTHGAGFHSLLYFISLLRIKNLQTNNIAYNADMGGGYYLLVCMFCVMK